MSKDRVRAAVSEYIWLATYQSKIYENKTPSSTEKILWTNLNWTKSNCQRHKIVKLRSRSRSGEGQVKVW